MIVVSIASRSSSFALVTVGRIGRGKKGRRGIGEVVGLRSERESERRNEHRCEGRSLNILIVKVLL